MNKQEKANFIMSLGNMTTTKMIAALDAGKIPEDWQGNELRALFSLIAKSHVFPMTRNQKSEFNTTVMINDLV